MKSQMLRGTLEPLALIDILAYVARLKETGILKVSRGEQQKTVVIHKGNIIFARSNLHEDRLGDMLLMQGQITQEQYDQATQLLKEKGYRHGRSLVEIGAITPKTLWLAIQNQVKNIAYSVVPWNDGNFEFTQQEIKQREQITLELPVMDMVVDVIRHFDQRTIFKSKFDLNDVYAVGERNKPGTVQLEPYEEYIYRRIDGEKSVAKICEQSDLGFDETARVFFLLRSLGWIKKLGGASADNSPFAGLIGKYNQMFGHLNQYLTKHLGSVGTSLMRKYLEETRQIHSGIFGDVELSAGGTLDPGRLTGNIEVLGFDESAAAMALEEALGEYLYACILAVKKALGTDHETRVVQELEAFQ